MDLKDRRAVVLGGTSGIGLAAALRLEAQGARVTVCGRSEAHRQRARAQLSARSDVRELDVLDRAALAALFEELAPVDVLVNAATGGERATGPFLDMDLDGFQGSFRKLWGYVNAVRLGGAHLAEDAVIVLVSGFPARKCPPGFSAISTVGNAVEGFARAMAVELAPVRVNVVSPGTIDTPMFPVEGEARAQFLAQATAGNLISRAGTADEVAQAILACIDNDFMTGAVLDVDGGALLP